MANRDNRRVASASGVVLDERSRVLLQRRADDGRWALPAGAIEPGERAEQAAEREVLEETGYRVEAVRLVGVYSDPAHTTRRYPDGTVVAYVALAYACRVVGGSARTSDESLEVAWFEIAALPASLSEGHRMRVLDALALSPAAFMR